MKLYLRAFSGGFKGRGAFFANSSLKNSDTSSTDIHGSPNKDFRNAAIGPRLELY